MSYSCNNLLERARIVASKIRSQRDLSIERGGEKGDKWRVEAMKAQVPPQGNIPLLIARDVPWRKGHCLSCGDQLPEGVPNRCIPCVQAAQMVIHGGEIANCQSKSYQLPRREVWLVQEDSEDTPSLFDIREGRRKDRL